jgi:cation diffusion facilitator CzcD-associated flavoprotein CzcO
VISICIIGSGFSGLGLAIRLRQEGHGDFVVLERGLEVGGTWRDNTYPGCACDIQSHLYSFSFAPNPEWSRAYSPQPEILRYLIGCADRFDVRKFCRFGVNVTGLEWRGDHWSIRCADGSELSARSVVMATGPLSEPSIPRFEGSFAGRQFHSAEWDASFDARGLRVGVVGNGASAVQFIPLLQKEAKHLVVFQRTAAWVVPRPNRAFASFEKWIFRNVPGARASLRGAIYWAREVFSLTFRHPRWMRILEWMSLRRLKREVRDPVLRAKLTPHYTIGCKRILLSDDYWPSLAAPNVDVVTDPIMRLEEGAAVTSGSRYELDALIYATGFRVTDSPFYAHVIGREGISLETTWKGSPKAYLGTMTRGFPNLFFLLGPNTGLGHTSVVLMIEAQIEHLLKVFDRLKSARAVEPRASAQDEFIGDVDRDLKTTVWNAGGCRSWYLDRTGRNSTIWPKSVVSYRKLMESKNLEGYEVLT